MKKIGFLFYSSHSWGMGHVYRTITIMELLKSKYQVIALTNDYQQTLTMLNEHSLLYECIKINDILTLNSRLQELNLDILVIDKLDNTEEDMKLIKDKVDYIVNLDDQGDGAYLTDILINAIVPLPKKISNQTFFGTEYMVFNKNTELYASYNKVIRSDASKLLVCFGGSDPRDITSFVLDFLSKLFYIEVDVVLGPGYSNPQEIYNKYSQYKNINIHCNLPSLAKLIFESDICIISGGLTLFECVYIGTPSIVICQVEHQRVTANKYQEKGCLLNMGLIDEVTLPQLKDTLLDLMSNVSMREKLSYKSKEEISLNGVYNIVKLIDSQLKEEI